MSSAPRSPARPAARRKLVHDLDFIVATPKPAELTAFFATQPFAKEVIAHGDTKCSILLENGMQCDLRAVSNEQYPFALVYFTGSKEHNVAIRSRALKQGWSLNEYGFTPARNLPVVRDEADIYRALGLDFVPPELRENPARSKPPTRARSRASSRGKTSAAPFTTTPPPVDGRLTLDEMAEAAQELGLHTWASPTTQSPLPGQRPRRGTAPRPARRDRRARTASYGGRSSASSPGRRCDILKDGSLDFDDDLLARTRLRRRLGPQRPSTSTRPR